MQLKRSGLWKRALKGALLGTALSLFLVLLLSLCLYKEWLGLEHIGPFNTAIKVLSAAFASLMAIRKPMGRRWLTGALAGFFYAFFAYMLFMLLSGSLSLSLRLLSDLGMGLLSGMLSAMIRQMLK